MDPRYTLGCFEIDSRDVGVGKWTSHECSFGHPREPDVGNKPTPSLQETIVFRPAYAGAYEQWPIDQ